MTTSSANPDELDAFVTGGPATRSDCESTSNTGIRVAPEVQSRCGSRGLSTTNFPAVAALLENMQANEEFVRGVANALRTADVHDGIAVMSDTAIASQFAPGSYDTATTAVTIEASSAIKRIGRLGSLFASVLSPDRSIALSMTRSIGTGSRTGADNA